MACSSSCPTPGAHATWGECVKSKGLKIAFCGVGGLDASTQKKWDSDLDAYRTARAQGIQPSSTRRAAVDRAVRISDATGKAFTA